MGRTTEVNGKKLKAVSFFIDEESLEDLKRIMEEEGYYQLSAYLRKIVKDFIEQKKKLLQKA